MNDSMLSVGMFGDEVKLLHDRLRKHGFDIPASEVERGFFGPATRQAVQECQREHGLPATGTVDERTAAAMNAAIAAKSDGSLQPSSANLLSTGPGPAVATRASAASIASPVALAASLPTVAPPTTLRASISLPGAFIPNPNPSGTTDTTPGLPPMGSRDDVFIVRGLVRQTDGTPFSGALVVAMDRDLRGEEVLGQATTNRDGYYEIRYTSNRFARAEKGSADLVVRAMDAAGVVLAASPILFNAPAEATIDLVVELNAPGVLSEFERVVNDIEPLLVNVSIHGLPAVTLIDKLADLKPDEIDFVIGETGIEQNKVMFLVSSALLQKKAAEQQASVPAAAFYGLAREGLPLQLAALGMRSQKESRDALEHALNENIIPTALRNSLDKILGQLQELAARSALQVTPGDRGHSLSELLSGALSSLDQQATLLMLSANHTGSPEEFWSQLRAHPDFQDNGTVERIQLTLQLGMLTQNHLPLIQELQQTDQIKTTRDLVKLDAAAWTDLVNRQANGNPVGIPPGVSGATQQERIANYVNSIVSVLQAAFPTDTVAQLIAKAPNINLDAPTRQTVTRFFANSPDFDLRKSHVDTYAAENAATAFDGIAEGDRPEVISQVKRLQRTFQVSTSAETMTALLSRGFDSAHAIANIPRKAFLAQHAFALGGEQQALMIHERSQYINARNLQLYVHLNDALNGVQTMAMGEWSEEAKQAFIGRRPNYTELFGSMDLCDCKHCRSVLSPAAYFVDLLEFLRHSIPNTTDKTPLDVLLTRRPDLEHMKLTCENTNTTLPYVDLVNEVLESYVTYLASLQSQQPQSPSILAHDTADATAQELDANPQNTNDEAYRVVAQAVYPFTLPFNQPIEVERIFLQHLGISRYDLLSAFQKEQSVKTDRATHAEYLGITPEEYQILTEANFDPTVQVRPRPLREFYGYNVDQVGRPEDNPTVTKLWKEWLADVPEFLQRTGISYVDLIETLKTQFINPAYPEGEALEFLRRIPLSFATLAALAQSNFANPSQEALDALQRAGIALRQLIDWSNANFQRVRKVIVLDAPDSKCDLSVTRLQHLDGSLLDDAELSKLHRFIRLWRKIGWSIAKLDRAMMALRASEITPDALIQLAQTKQLQDQSAADIEVLLSLWAPINTHGDDSLYKKLFLNKATLRIDDVFKPKPDGSLLSDTGLKLSEHVAALLAALRISAADLALIRRDAQLDAETAPLNLANVSTLYRYAALARALKLRVDDLLALKSLSGINPFAAPRQTIEFATVVTSVRQSGFKVAHLSYLYRHLTAPPTSLAPQPATVRLLAKGVRDGLVRIAQDNALAPDPTGDLTRAKLALLFDSATVDQTIAMINGSAVYSAPLAQLPSGIVFPNLAKNKISFDQTAKVLRFTGAMTTAEQGALINASADTAYQAAVNSLFQQPSTFIKDALSGFLDVKEAEKNLLRDIPSLDQDVKPMLLDLNGNPTADPTKAVETAAGNKFTYVLARLLPYLRNQLGHSFVKQTIADALKLDNAMVQRLLETVLKSQADPQQPAVADLLALATPGLTGNYFTSNNLTGISTARTDPAIGFGGTAATIPSGTQSARWSGMLLAPGNGTFTFSVRATGSVELWVGDSAQPLALQLDSSTNELVTTNVPLKAGQLYDLRLEITNLPLQSAVVELRWQSATIPREITPSDNLYRREAIDNLTATFSRLHKAALIVGTFRLTDKEVEYLADHRADFDGFDLNLLPLGRDPASAVQIDQQAVALFKAWQRLNELVALRNSLPQGEVSLIDVFGAASLDEATVKLGQATGWDPPVLASLADSFKLTAAAFKNEIWVTRLQSCVNFIKRAGVSAKQLFDSTSLDADFTQLRNIAQEIKKTVRAKYDEEMWLKVAKPLNDTLREKQRDALVAYLLPRLGMSGPNQLFEYFLIDAEMSACMATSRIKQAISSVQLFVQRCLVNLEEVDDRPELTVSSTAIDADQWECMKHYRVWEANRKILLYPENWIEPGLRDDKSPFFKQLESELLQNDLTKDTAKTAFLNYLEKLDQVARLEICGIYWQDKDTDTGEEVNILHVFGRTFHDPRIYYYRRLSNNREWTPWEQVQVDIQGDHLIPVVWKRRLYIFWPVFTQKAKAVDVPPSVDARAPIPTHPPQKYWEIKLAWSEYRQNTWSPKRLSEQALNLTPADSSDDIRDYVFKTEVTKDEQGRENDLVVHCEYYVPASPDGGRDSRHMVVVGACRLNGNSGETIRVDPAVSKIPRPIIPAGAGFDAMTFAEKPDQESLALPGQDGQESITFLEKTPTSYTLLYPHQFEQYTLQAPFFYEDTDRTFFVEPYEAVSIIEQIIDYNTINVSQHVQAVVNAVTAMNGDNGFNTPNRAAPATTISLPSGSADLDMRGASPIALAAPMAPTARIAAPISVPSSRFEISDWSFTTSSAGNNWPSYHPLNTTTYLQFHTFRHPYVSQFIKSLNRQDVPGLLTVANQTLGNPYWHSLWKLAFWGQVTAISEAATGPACIIQGDFGGGPIANFEAVVVEGSKLVHYWRDNSSLSEPWQRGDVITSNATGPGWLVQSDWQTDGHGHLEVVVLEGNNFVHYYRDDTGWHRDPGIITSSATGAGGIIQSDYGSGGHGRYEVLALEGSDLVHYWHDSNPNSSWQRDPEMITSDATSPGCIIQSDYMDERGHGHFEVVVCEGSDLVHHTFDGTSWQRGDVITSNATGAGCIIQSNIRDGTHGNFEVVVPEGKFLIHYWRDNSQPNPHWQRGQIITSMATGPACLIQSTFGKFDGFYGNFEVAALEGNRLAHYWNSNSERFFFARDYLPDNAQVGEPYPIDDIDFRYGGAYSLYNWELFFHAPLLIATRLSRNQGFRDAMQWFHYIFNPIDASSNELPPARYWKVLPFKSNEPERIEVMMRRLNAGDTELARQVDDWRHHPFQPHRIARMRLGAYQKHVVMKYVENLIAWGDQLFRQDTIESINEATQFYVLAASLLGSRPQRLPARGLVAPEAYVTLKGKLDGFGNVLSEFQNEFPLSGVVSSDPKSESRGLLGLGKTLYFCTPQNDILLGYWDTVADRLFKVRHCMNIEGVVRQLPLFEPPIDPALLVQAAAQGVDLSSVLNDMSAPLPYYRFTFVLQKALDFCNDVKALGSALLAALEKQDAEHLSYVRAQHETGMLQAIRAVKEAQVAEAATSVEGLRASRRLAIERCQHYAQLLGHNFNVSQEPAFNTVSLEGRTQAPAFYPPRQLALQKAGRGEVEGGGTIGGVIGAGVGAVLGGAGGGAAGAAAGQAIGGDISGQLSVNMDSGAIILDHESDELTESYKAAINSINASALETLSSTLSLIPNFEIATKPLGAGVSVHFGSTQLAAAPAAVARVYHAVAAWHQYKASLSGRMASFQWREHDWGLQGNLAAREIEQIDKQIVTAMIRQEIAQRELNNHDRQIENAKEIEQVLSTKFTREALYDWMQQKVARLYSDAYQMSYDLAKKAERAFRFERGLTTSNFIQFGYWDSLRKGLLAGEQLYLALKQMERAYLDQNKREYEITKHISLMLHNPLALIALKETGWCEVELPEVLFDADYPGHYMRRVKSVGLTIPCVVGPYTSINCTLTLLSNKTRVKSVVGDSYAEREDGEDDRFVTNFAAMQSITTSHAQNDSGMFELNFRDERYLPFEGAGVISRWRIDMPKDTNAFDFDTLSDVVLHLKYTAREGGEILGNAARKAMQDAIADTENTPLARLFSLKHEFPTEWYRFLTAAAEKDDAATGVNKGDHFQKFAITNERFPFFARRGVKIGLIRAFAIPKTDPLAPFKLYLTPAGDAPDTNQNDNNDAIKLEADPTLNGLLHEEKSYIGNEKGVGDWSLKIAKTDYTPLASALDDIWLLFEYGVA